MTGQRQCWIDFPEAWHWRLYVTLVALALFAIPTLIISACYTIIVCTIWSKSFGMSASSRKNLDGRRVSAVRAVRRGTALGSLKGGTASGGSGSKEETDCRRASSRGLIPRAKVKTVKMTLVIVLVFVLCWSPFFVFDLLQVYGYIPHTQTYIAVASFVQSLAPLNSAANPLIYCLFSTQFCRTLRKVPPFSWVLGLRHSSPTAPTDANSAATETVTHLGTSPSRRGLVRQHHVTIRLAGPGAGPGPGPGSGSGQRAVSAV